jgi:hypothetical protein
VAGLGRLFFFFRFFLFFPLLLRKWIARFNICTWQLPPIETAAPGSHLPPKPLSAATVANLSPCVAVSPPSAVVGPYYRRLRRWQEPNRRGNRPFKAIHANVESDYLFL